VYISFVPTEMSQDYEEDHKKKDTFSANRCILHARNSSGTTTQIFTRKEFETAVTNNLQIEITP